MKQYAPIMIGLILLGLGSAQANNGPDINTNPTKQTDAATAADAKPAAPLKDAASPMTAPKMTPAAATSEEEDTLSSQPTLPQTAAQTSATDGKASPVLENQPAANNTMDEPEEAAQAQTPTDVKNAEADAVSASKSPNVQNLFKFFHTQKQQAEADPVKKDAPSPAPDKQSPQ